MFKFAFAIGIIVEWFSGPEFSSAVGFGFAAGRAFIATLAAWMVLEAMRAIVRAVLTLDDGRSNSAG